PTTSSYAGTSTRRRRDAPRSSGSPSPGSRCRTPTPGSSVCSRGSSGGRLRYRRPHEAGAIEVESAGRRFRVYPQPVRTLKELVVARGRVKGTDIQALQDVSVSVEPGEAV